MNLEHFIEQKLKEFDETFKISGTVGAADMFKSFLSTALKEFAREMGKEVDHHNEEHH